MTSTTSRDVLSEVGLILAGFYTLMIVAMIFELGGIGVGSKIPKWIEASGGIASVALILVGIRVAPSKLWLGWLLVVLGAAPPAIRMSWVLFTPVIWILAGVFLVVRVTRHLKRRRAPV